MTSKQSIQEDELTRRQDEGLTEIKPHWKLTSQKYDLTKRQEEGLTGR